MKLVIFAISLIFSLLSSYVNARSKLGPMVTDKVSNFCLFYHDMLRVIIDAK